MTLRQFYDSHINVGWACFFRSPPRATVRPDIAREWCSRASAARHGDSRLRRRFQSNRAHAQPSPKSPVRTRR